ncbi:MAG TPA: pilus assembly protein TadG-related protein [Candidatus Dormibacteraeota bacterium]|nr:pilus assembly protein TadG-related protein [Candidatus Dormibacteraeota bacterium]
MTRQPKSQSGQVMVLVAVSLIALIGSAALVLLAGSAEWQKNQLQQVADQAALEAALSIGIGCDAAKAKVVIDAADASIGKQRTASGAYSGVGGGPCAAGYSASQTFSNGALSAAINYPYRAHQQQVEVILTLTLPISFGTVVGKSSTTVVRRAVAQALPGSVPALSATTLTCTGGQVNVAGSVVAQNAVTLSGGCAVYAHTRFDAASSTYSDLGNASVYADGQAWVGGGGNCTPAASSGSTNAICADGSEISGHVTPTCGTTSAFLSVGDALINPNPCAAGVARPPVPPVSTTLPPEPNTDPTAIAQLVGTGGAACSPAGAYANIVVNGATVGTGLSTPTLVGGYYHFKPSCYGYLNIGPLNAGISKVQVGPVATAKHFITPTFAGPTTAGTLLVATIRSDATPTRFAAPAGWTEAGVPSQAGTSPRTEIWYYENNPVWVGPITFTITPANIDSTAQVSEWANVASVNPVDTTGNFAVGANQLTATVSTAGNTSAANDLVITNDGILEGQAGQIISNSAGWNSLANDPTDGFTSEYRLDLPGAAIASETETASVTTTWGIVMAAFKPSGGGSGAVFDPGFYYFNGYDGAAFTNGGICLNGGTLLAQDTTLEFVNKASFTSGDCTAGGGASCSSPCQFGSTPCSISACPPNAPLSSSSLTWFSAPCSLAPAGDTSCPGPGWCTNGDRACLNVLIWSSSTGQIAIKGPNAKHWLLGSIYWPGACTDTVNGTSTIAGTVSCGSLSISAGAGAGTAIGGDYGIATSLVEAILVE